MVITHRTEAPNAELQRWRCTLDLGIHAGRGARASDACEAGARARSGTGHEHEARSEDCGHDDGCAGAGRRGGTRAETRAGTRRATQEIEVQPALVDHEGVDAQHAGDAPRADRVDR
jgi:hypothetical protein